jgi:tRNA-splicing ligase RtcB
MQERKRRFKMSKATESKAKWLDDSGKIVYFGNVIDDETKTQIQNCAVHPSVHRISLSADNHRGYSTPIGATVAYNRHISPTGVGPDIGCGNMCVRTPLKYDEIKKDIKKIADAMWKDISFGVGRKKDIKIEHKIFEDPVFKDIPNVGKLKDLASSQLGTVGAGNHFCDIFVEEATQDIWVANHFGSRGFGYKIATGFINLIDGIHFNDRGGHEDSMALPKVISMDSPLGQDYFESMKLAGRYAYAGREHVIGQVLRILKTTATKTVHNNHNLAWIENHDGQELYVVRKGATPLAPKQEGYVGGSMCDISVIVEGVDTEDSREGLYSAMHGAGRVLGRMQAKGKWKHQINASGKKELVNVRPGKVSPEMFTDIVKEYGIELRGAGLDESPFCYKKLQDVIDAHDTALKVNHVLKPIIVAMADDSSGIDPYKD